MKIRWILLLSAVIAVITADAGVGADSSWNKKKCAVVLTYDDGLNLDLSTVIPVLNAAGLRGTFYISDNLHGLKDQIFKWRVAAGRGHELANHTIHHPCNGSLPGRGFVTPDYDLNLYTVRRMVDEIRSMNNTLKAIDGKTERTFAYPCGDTKIHDTSYIDGLHPDFVAARGVTPSMLPAAKVDLYNVGCYSINGQSGDDLVKLVKEAMASHTLLVFLFHGVGGGHALNVSLEAHNQLIAFLKNNKNNIWVAPMIDVAKYIKQKQSQPINIP